MAGSTENIGTMIPMTLTETERAIFVAVIAASATIMVAVLTGLIAYFSAKRQQRRLVYSEAVKAAVGWKEMVYRVRRRRPGTEDQLIQDFHMLQDNLAYYEAWIGSESVFMARSYKCLVAKVKAKTETLIQKAWREEIRPLPGDAREADEHPDIRADVDAFLLDVRRHVSPWPWRKLSMVWSNWKEEG